MLRPQALLTGQAAVATRRKPDDDALLAAEVARRSRKIEAARAERRRVADLYQAGFFEQRELLRRLRKLHDCQRAIETQREALIAGRGELAQKKPVRSPYRRLLPTKSHLPSIN